MKKNKVFFFLLLILLVMLVAVSCAVSKSEDIEILNLDALIKSNDVETKENNFFAEGKNAHLFVDKFNLSKEELDIVGIWTKIFTTPVEQTHENIKILTIDFYPNRINQISCMYRDIDNKLRRIQVYSKWKMKGNVLYLKPYHIIESDQHGHELKHINIKQDLFYTKVAEIPDFDKGFVINRQIDYSFLNKYFDNSKFKFHLDTVRLRITHEYGLPCIFDKINAKDDICDYYLNADFETIENMEWIFL